jgi:hypothetical protein
MVREGGPRFHTPNSPQRGEPTAAEHLIAARTKPPCAPAPAEVPPEATSTKPPYVAQPEDLGSFFYQQEA